MSRKQSLGREGEGEWGRLLAAYTLEQRRGVAVAISTRRDVLEEVHHRLTTLAPEVLRIDLLEPCVPVIQELGKAHAKAKALPVVWLEQPKDSNLTLDDAWRRALASLNMGREVLGKEGPVFLILAGPPELKTIVPSRAPDLWSVAGPFLELGETLEEIVEATLPIEWLHLSDLHIRGHGDWRQDPVLGALLRELPELLGKANIKPQLVMVTGDLAYSGIEQELEGAHRYLKELMATLGLRPQEHLFLVPGNHDVDRNRIGRMVRRDLGSLLAMEGEAFRKEVGEILGSSGDLGLYGERLQAWCDFTARLLGPARSVTPERPWRTDYRTLGGMDVGIASLCSAWASGPDDDRPGRIILGERQVREALKEIQTAPLRIMLLHHPLDWLHPADQQAIAGLLRAEAHIVLHGHLHMPNTLEVSSHRSSHILSAAGAVYQDAPWKMAFQAGCLDPSQERENLTIQYYAWSDAEGGFWHEDSGVCRGMERGRGCYTLRLPEVRSSQEGADEALAQRLRRAAGRVHGQHGFIGLPGVKPKQSVTVTDIYVPAEFQGEGEERAPLIKVEADLWGRKDAPEAARLVVLGGPGSGKTTLTRYLAYRAATGDSGMVPLLIALRNYMKDGEGKGLLEYAAEDATRRLWVRAAASDLEGLCKQGRAVLLIDGLDEVRQADDRLRLRDMVQGLSHAYPKAPMVVTSRISGYDQAPLDGKVFRHLRLAPFTDEQIEAFVRLWYATALPDDPVERSRRQSDLLNALSKAPQARSLARTPLLATLIALVHGSEVTLPHQRSRLYDRVIHVLLETWPEATGRRFALLDTDKQGLLLQELAWEMQEGRGRGDRGLSLSRSKLEQQLTNIIERRGLSVAGRPAQRLARRYLEYLEADTGLLVEQSPGEFAFLHRSLMEYLAALYLHGETLPLADRVEEVRKRLFGQIQFFDAEGWEEVANLFMAVDAQRTQGRGHGVFLRGITLFYGRLVLWLAGLLGDSEVPFSPAERKYYLAAVLDGGVVQDSLGPGPHHAQQMGVRLFRDPANQEPFWRWFRIICIPWREGESPLGRLLQPLEGEEPRLLAMESLERSAWELVVDYLRRAQPENDENEQLSLVCHMALGMEGVDTSYHDGSRLTALPPSPHYPTESELISAIPERPFLEGEPGWVRISPAFWGLNLLVRPGRERLAAELTRRSPLALRMILTTQDVPAWLWAPAEASLMEALELATSRALLVRLLAGGEAERKGWTWLQGRGRYREDVERSNGLLEWRGYVEKALGSSMKGRLLPWTRKLGQEMIISHGFQLGFSANHIFWHWLELMGQELSQGGEVMGLKSEMFALAKRHLPDRDLAGLGPHIHRLLTAAEAYLLRPNDPLTEAALQEAYRTFTDPSWIAEATDDEELRDQRIAEFHQCRELGLFPVSMLEAALQDLSWLEPGITAEEVLLREVRAFRQWCARALPAEAPQKEE